VAKDTVNVVICYAKAGDVTLGVVNCNKKNGHWTWNTEAVKADVVGYISG